MYVLLTYISCKEATTAGPPYRPTRFSTTFKACKAQSLKTPFPVSIAKLTLTASTSLCSDSAREPSGISHSTAQRVSPVQLTQQQPKALASGC